jgi:hypothetical protein
MMSRSNEQLRKYMRATKELGEQEGAPAANAWDPTWEAAGSNDDEEALKPFYNDGIHLAAQGYKVRDVTLLLNGTCDDVPLAFQIEWDVLIKTVKTNFPELHPDKVKMDLCRWVN